MSEREREIERKKLVDGKPSPWSVETLELADGASRAVRIFGEHASELINARQARQLGNEALVRFGASEDMTYSAELILSELGTNAIRYGGALNEVDIIWTPETDNREETIDICVTNPAETTMGTPGTLRRGELAAPEVDHDNHKATHGRGLQLVDEYTDHNWGQSNELSLAGTRDMNTYAVLYGHKQPEFDLDSFDEAA